VAEPAATIQVSHPRQTVRPDAEAQQDAEARRQIQRPSAVAVDEAAAAAVLAAPVAPPIASTGMRRSS
jgi:hypothetical protein